MAPIISTTEVARPADEVFSYVIDPSTMSEWQEGVVRGHLNTPATRVGSRCTTVRKIGGREREVTTEITEYDPPRRWADRGIEGPIRVAVAAAVKPSFRWQPIAGNHRVGFHGSWDREAVGAARCP